MKSTLSTKIAAAAATTGMALAALMGVAGPAHAADTTATFTITAGGLSMTVPTTTVALGSVAAGTLTVAGQLGSVTVTDSRGALVNAWTATVSSTAFVLPGATPTANETVAKTNIAYASGLATSTSGLGTFVPGTATMTAAGTGAAWTGAAGNASAAWNPTMTFTLLPSQVAGTYSGTITHSVA